jgi:hypothetical protein
VTDWTVPKTWGPTPEVPSAANLDALRNQILHLHETLDGFGYPYAPIDPRLLGTSTASYAHASPKYLRCYGRGTITAIRVQVKTSSGDVTYGVYDTNPENDWPGARKATTSSVACPSVGIADTALLASVDVDPGDWFAWAGTAGGSATIAGVNGVGFELITFHVSTADVATALTDLPETADPNLDTSGAPRGPSLVGVP